MKSRFAACLCAAAFAALAYAPTGAMAKDFQLKISHWVPPSHPLQAALEDWAASVKKESQRHYHRDDLSVAAARQGLRPL